MRRPETRGDRGRREEVCFNARIITLNYVIIEIFGVSGEKEGKGVLDEDKRRFGN